MRPCGGRNARGFTLIELVVAIAVLSILAGAALPVATRVAERAARRSTEQELELLRQAALELYADTGRLPRTVAELERPPADADAARGWAGPYLVGGPLDPIGGGGRSHAHDGWSRPYALTLEPARDGQGAGRLVFASAGADAAHGTRDDLVAEVELAPLLRERTLARLAVVNDALARQRDATGAPLVLDARGGLRAALETLVDEGLLPEVELFLRDAWGAELVADPPGSSAGAGLVRVRSTRIGAGSLGSAPVAPRAGLDDAWRGTLEALGERR